jgi:arsenite-transporting ATPase
LPAVTSGNGGSAPSVDLGNHPSIESLITSPSRKYVMVSGKGGVGKTSLSASLAIKFAQHGHTTLLVSTDPAHSLSDSLDQDVSGGSPIQVQGIDYPLFAMEIDPEVEKENFKQFTASDKSKDAMNDIAGGFGFGLNQLTSLFEQLSDIKLGELLDSPPPGFDEAVAIAKVQQFVTKEEFAKFSRIVFDTAPTGHTLRLLTVPEFVDASLTKIIELRKSLMGASDAVVGLFGGNRDQNQVDRLEELRESIRQVSRLFRDESSTEFIIATIPTMLAVNESIRLANALKKEHIPCHRVVVNQVIGEGKNEAYLKMKLKGQERALETIVQDENLGSLKPIMSPYLDLEVRGVPALKYFGNRIWSGMVDELAGDESQRQRRRFYMLGGKGGVGKTSCSASLAVELGALGLKTLVVSTDPAHSLSDSVDQDLSNGGEPVEIAGTDGYVWGLEIDIEAAKEDLRGLGREDDGKGFDDFLDGLGLGGVTDQLKKLRLGEILDTPPPGIDEAAAIAKVVQLLKKEQFSEFSRIVFDTAPTGHTLRLLTLPEFVNTSIGKILRIRQQIVGVADSVKGIFTGGNNKVDKTNQQIEKFQESMAEAREIFRDETLSQFIIVTIPTMMAVNESSRLAEALQKEDVPVRYILVNQVLDGSTTEAFFRNQFKDQQRALKILKSPDSELGSLQVMEGPILDLEVRGVPALQYFGDLVWKVDQS